MLSYKLLSVSYSNPCFLPHPQIKKKCLEIKFKNIKIIFHYNGDKNNLQNVTELVTGVILPGRGSTDKLL